jgi:hypothetical protein
VSDGAEDRSTEKHGRAADVEALLREIQRYLGLLDALRISNPPRKRPGEGRNGT